MSRSNTVSKSDDQTPMKPIPTTIKERLGVTALRKGIGPKLRNLSGQEILAVTISGANSVAIVKEDYLYELINLCNTLLYDRVEQKKTPPPSKMERQKMLEDGKRAFKELLESE